MVEPADASEPVLEVWRRVVRELEAMNLAFAADADALRCYCEAVVIHRKASAVLARTGVLVRGSGGRDGQAGRGTNLVRNPAIQIQRDAAMTIRAFAQEFGLTPSARSSIRATDASASADDNPFSGTGT